MACGTVEVPLTLVENRIATCRFGGDFLGNLPVTDIESALKGVAYDYTSIHSCLSNLEIGQYLDGVEAGELAKLMMG